MNEIIKDILMDFFLVVGIGLSLKWLAFMIAWGVAEGFSKVTKNISLNLGKITLILKD